MSAPRLLAAVTLLTILGCGGGAGLPAAAVPAKPFTDVTAAAGLAAVHANGATERRFLPETMGAGVAFFDYDGDGWPDLFLPGGLPVAHLGDPRPGDPTCALYRNRGDGTFEDTTAAAGLAVSLLGMGAAVGDVDNDGDLDLYVTAVGGDRLFLNRGDGTFEDTTAAWGVGSPGFGSSAAFLDYDRDGWLDLYAGRYVEWSPETDRTCSPVGRRRSYCTPELYGAAPDRLYRNRNGQRFEDVTAAAGLQAVTAKTLGTVPLDHDRDGWPDLAVASDTSPNLLLLNRGDGTFHEVGLAAGMALAESGAPRGGMGIDAGDWTGDGLVDLVIGNFAQEMAAVYRATAEGIFSDEAAPAGVGLPTLMQVAFGVLMLDQDADGDLDLLFANGHVEPAIARFRRGQDHAQPLQLFRNRGDGTFEDAAAGPWSGPWVGRGLAIADYDLDGDPDVVLTQNGGPIQLLRNEANPRRWLRIVLQGTASNRTGYGSTLTAMAGDRRLVRTLVSGRSYLSASEPVIHLGLEGAPALDRLEITWPTGTIQVIEEPPLGRTLTVLEPASSPAAALRTPPPPPPR